MLSAISMFSGLPVASNESAPASSTQSLSGPPAATPTRGVDTPTPRPVQAPFATLNRAELTGRSSSASTATATVRGLLLLFPADEGEAISIAPTSAMSIANSRILFSQLLSGSSSK